MQCLPFLSKLAGFQATLHVGSPPRAAPSLDTTASWKRLDPGASIKGGHAWELPHNGPADEMRADGWPYER